MMYSDYYAISSCAISVIFLPFMVLSEYHYTRALQAFGYSNRKYFRWAMCAFVATLLPLILLSILAILEQFTLQLYLTHTDFDELSIIVGYALWLLIGCIAIALGFARYAKVIGRAMWTIPRIGDARLQGIFTASALVSGCFAMLCNMNGALRFLIYIMPVTVLFTVPLINIFVKPVPGRVNSLSPGRSGS